MQPQSIFVAAWVQVNTETILTEFCQWAVNRKLQVRGFAPVEPSHPWMLVIDGNVSEQTMRDIEDWFPPMPIANAQTQLIDASMREFIVKAFPMYMKVGDCWQVVPEEPWFTRLLHRALDVVTGLFHVAVFGATVWGGR
jgi:hypothetical protein